MPISSAYRRTRLRTGRGGASAPVRPETPRPRPSVPMSSCSRTTMPVQSLTGSNGYSKSFRPQQWLRLADRRLPSMRQKGRRGIQVTSTGYLGVHTTACQRQFSPSGASSVTTWPSDGPLSRLSVGSYDSDFDDLNLGTRLLARYGLESVVYTPFAVVHHFVPAERVTWRYFWRRCYFVNREKVRVFSNMGTTGNLAAERQFVIHALSRQAGLTLRRLIRGDINGLYALGAMLVGLGSAAAGHLSGRLDQMMAPRCGATGEGMSR